MVFASFLGYARRRASTASARRRWATAASGSYVSTGREPVTGLARTGSPKQLLGKLLELSREVSADLAYAFDGQDTADDLLARLKG